MRQIEHRMATLHQTCTHDATTIEDRGLVHLASWPASEHVPCHPTRTRSRTSYGNQCRLAPSRRRPRRSTYRWSLHLPRRQGSVHDGMGSRPGCVRASIAWRPFTRHAHTMGPPLRTGISYPLCHGLHPKTYRAIRRGRDRRPATGTSVRLLRPVDARVGRRIDGASIYHGGKILCMGWAVDHDASERASHGDPSPDMHTRWDHH
jgi:hypothetical protein